MPIRAWYQRHALPAFLLDVVLVIVFALTGRTSHGSDLTPWHVLGTAAPFLIALGAGWLGLRIAAARTGRFAWDRPWPAGVALWIVTAGAGVLLRVTLFAQTAAGAFLIITVAALGVLLLAPRLLLGRWRAGARRG